MESHIRSTVFEIFPTMVTTHDLSTDPSFNVMRDVVNKTKTSEHALMKNAESTYNESTGNAWLDNKWFRFGASSLANDLILQLEKEAKGVYYSKDYISVD